MSDEHVSETPADPEAARPTQILPTVNDIDAALAAVTAHASPDEAEIAALAPEPLPQPDLEFEPPKPVEPPRPPAVTVPAGSRVIAIVSRGPSPARPTVPVGMPELLGEEQGEALLKLQEVGLTATVLADYSDDVPRGYVMAQHPRAGTSAQPGTDTVVLASRGKAKVPAQRVVLPNVVGMAQTMAVDTLQSTSLAPRIHYDYDPVAAPGMVLAQLPSEDSPVPRIVRKGSGWWWVAAVVVLVLIAAAAAGIWYFNRPIPIPNLIGMSQTEGVQTLRDAGFSVGSVATSQTLSAADIGNIIAQAPSPGGSAPHGSTIDIIISGGQALIQVPNVTGVTQSQAQQTLNAAGLLSSVSQGYSSTVASGAVIAQAPAASQRVPSGTTVGLTVSMGAHTISVPGVVGQVSATGDATLKSSGFGTQLASNYDTTTLTGSVIGQMPIAGTASLPGTIVGLTVSKGQAPAGTGVATVVRVVGKTQAKAKSALTKIGLKVLFVTWSQTLQAKGHVAAQLPDSNAVLSKGSTVILFVSSGK